MRPLRLLIGIALVLAPAAALAQDADVVSGTLAQAKKTGIVRIGYRDASIPFSYLDRSAHPIGYSIDICNAIVDEMAKTLDRDELKIDYVKVTSDTRLQALVDNKIDLECGSTTANAERRKIVDFSPTIFITGTKVMVSVATQWKDFRDLKGRKVVVTKGTTNEAALQALDKKFSLGMTLSQGEDHEQSYQMLVDGKVEAFATDDVLLAGLIAKHRSQDKFKIVGEFLSYDPYGVAYRRSEPGLHAAVERAIRNLVVARDIGPMYSKWFESRLPGGERFNIVMPPQLTESFNVLGSVGESN